MVKKKSAPPTEKDRKVDEDSVAGEDRLQRSAVVKDVSPLDTGSKLDVAPASCMEVPAKRTRSRPQPPGAPKDTKATPSETEVLAAEGDVRSSDGTKNQPPSAVLQIATRSATGRLAKRQQKDAKVAKSPPRKQGKEAQPVTEGSNPEAARPRRAWELWSPEDKNLFFEALSEHGKDFDAIQSFMAQKHKKRGGTDSAAKTKDQIRHFFYRTGHKIMSYIDLPVADDTQKQALEIYGLVCYGEIRRKGLQKMNKMAPKLKELLTQGNTIIRVRGKNQRIKVPTCRAMKRLHNIDDPRDDSKLKLPERITLKLHPRTNSAWSHVQMLSQNPRVIVNIQPDQHLSAVFDYLGKKWRLECLEMKESLGEKTVDPMELRLHVSPDCSLTPISINRSSSQPKMDFTWGSLMENFKSFGASGNNSISPPNKRSLKVSMSRIDDPTSKPHHVTETAKTVNSSVARTCEEDKQLLTSTISVPSLSDNHLHGSQIHENGTVAMNIDDNACDASSAVMDYVESVDRSGLPPATSEFGITSVLTHSDAVAQDTTCAVGCIVADTPCSTAGATISTTTVPLTLEAPLATPLSSSTTVTTTAQLATNTLPCSSSSVLIERLSGPIDRTVAQEVTVAELFVMAGRPRELALDYDWIGKPSAGSRAEQGTSGVSALQHLVNIAVTEFAGFSRISSSGRLGAQSPPSIVTGARQDVNSCGAKGFVRSPRVRQNQGISRTRKDSVGVALDASLDQSANCPWFGVSSFDNTNLLQTAPRNVTTVAQKPGTFSGVAADEGNASKTQVISNNEGTFRVPQSLPPKLQTKNGEIRTIVDKTVLDGLSIYSSKRSDLRKVRTRSSRKPLVVQRTILPKSQQPVSQLVTLTLVPGLSSSQTGSFLPIDCSTVVTSQLQSIATASEPVKSSAVVTSDAQQNVIKMAPTQLKSSGIRRVFPVPVPADSPAVFPEVESIAASSSRSNAPMTASVTAHENVNVISAAISESSLQRAIIGVDAFLESSESQESISVQQGATRSLTSSLTPSFLPSLGDSNLSMPSLLDMSLNEDMDLMNSNSSFTGILSTIEDKNPSSALTLSNDDSLLNPAKDFPGITNTDEAVAWNELSLSSFASNFTPDKKEFEKSVSLAVSVATSSAVQSGMFMGDNSRDSSLLATLNTADCAFQTLLNEDSMCLTQNFTRLFGTELMHPHEANRTLQTVASGSSGCGFASNT